MILANVDYYHGSTIIGEFRVRNPRYRVASNGCDYVAMNIEDRSAELKAYLWPGENQAEFFNDCDCVSLKGKLRRFNEGWLVNISRIDLLQQQSAHPVKLIPRSLTPLPSLLEQLDQVVNFLSIQGLRNFVLNVLADDAIAFPFVSLPASSRHHHCTGSGLLEHSLECVAMIERYKEFERPVLEIGIVGALFHDIGKIRTLRCPGKHTLSGHVLDHDALTLEVLACHLNRLDTVCPDSAIALRYLWTWRNKKGSSSIPLLTIAEVISAADRISSGLNMEEVAFQDCPDWQRFVKPITGHAIWRPKLEIGDSFREVLGTAYQG